MTIKITIAGFGGQGVLSAGKMIARAALIENKNVTWMPSYGAEMRGGTANCSVVVSDKAIASPVVSRPDFLAALNDLSLLKFENNIVTNGTLLLNSSLISDSPKRTDLTVYRFPGNELAEKAENPRGLGMAVAGAIAGITNVVTLESLMQAVYDEFQETKAAFVKINQVAAEYGYRFVQDGKG